MKVYARLEGDLGEMTPAELLSRLGKLQAFNEKQKKGNGLVVRCYSDEEYFEMIGGLNEQIQRSANGSALIGGVVIAWLVDGKAMPDGGGWRMILVPQPMQAQQPGIPQGMPRLVPGRG